LKRIEKSTTVVRDRNKQPEGLREMQWRMFVDHETAQERMNVCWACPNLNSVRVCRKCWCLMPVKTKIAAMSCPLGHWPAEPNYVYKA